MQTGTWILGLLPLTGCIAAMDDTYQVGEHLEGVVIEHGNGDVQVTGVPTQGALLQVDFGGLAGNNVGYEVREGVLFIDLDCGTIDTCGGDLDLQIQEDAWVAASLDRGDMHIDSMHGNVDASVGAGDLGMDHMSSSHARLSVGAGDASADWAVRPTELYLNVGAGDGSAEVPAGAYALNLEVHGGSMEVDGVVHDSGASGYIQGTTGAGALRVEGW